jgi:large subunit ribosomal protein L25
MQQVSIQSEIRSGVGKGVARQLRREGRIPAVLYRAGTSVPISLNPKEISKCLRAASGKNTLITLQMEAGDPRVAILREFQRDPLTGSILHADLFEISMDAPIEVKVPVFIVGSVPMGVKDGGLLQHYARELIVRCLPALIPDRIEIDASTLGIRQSIHAKEISLEAGVAMVTDGDRVVVTVASAMSEAKLQALLTSSEKGGAEPELLGKQEEEPGKGKEAGKGDAKGKAAPKSEGKAKEAKK